MKNREGLGSLILMCGFLVGYAILMVFGVYLPEKLGKKLKEFRERKVLV